MTENIIAAFDTFQIADLDDDMVCIVTGKQIGRAHV